MSDHGPDTGGDDFSHLAAEYVLGVQDAAARARSTERLRNDTAFQVEVAAWEERLAPFLDEVAETPAPAQS